MGVKMIGAFCDAIKDTDLIDPRKYLAGFQIIPDEIPGFGAIHFSEVKVSMRVAASMEAEIRSGKVHGTERAPAGGNEQAGRILRCMPQPDGRDDGGHRQGSSNSSRKWKKS